MSWRDKLSPASFRGVQFFVESHDHSFGRDRVVHKFPNRDTPYSEDTGKLEEGFKVTGYLLGDDYMTARDNLKEALNKEGEGILIHPYIGKLTVQAGPCSSSESKNEGGMVIFEMDFVEKGEVLFPEIATNPLVDVVSFADSVIESSSSEFEALYDIASMPGHVIDAARAGIETAIDTFNDSTKFIANIADEAANFYTSVKALQSSINELASAPSRLAQRLQDSLALAASVTDDPDEKKAIYKAVASFSVSSFSAYDTPSRQVEAENNKQLSNLVIRTSVANQAKALTEVEFVTSSDAQVELEQIEIVIREQMESTQSDDVYMALSGMLSSLTEALLDQERYYSSVQRFKPNSYEPTLVHLFEKSESLENEADFISRNNISHPGFVSPENTLEIVNA